MTQAFSELPQGNEPQDLTNIQCHLCLRDIQYSKSNESVVEKGFITCNYCGNKQPTTKFPRLKDIAIFGITVSAVYIATIIAILSAR